MTGLDSDCKEALRYAIRNCPARTTGQLAAIDYAERAIRQGLNALSPMEQKTLALELGFWLSHYQRIQEFSAPGPADAETAQTPAASPTRKID
ncbi:hypothetical protein [Pseudomonas oryzihabitans]|uniref:DUF3077 domain-containing protein n=1 Tax=Pseudomonas oryzihabitans TaxID=47885 RepID=A0ABX3ILU8_9PSED|nr:hypothetical protein [Pseudomonas psychrotolerans]ONN68804.1 hypothetical protein BVL52_23965 [Pseudomonas psychrotolerans]